MSIKFLVAMVVAKSVRLVLRLLGRNGTFLPGDIALKIDSEFLAHVKKPETFIAVTGTNGKTTTSNLINTVFEKNGIRVMNNSLGSNVQSGIAGCFVEHCSLSGKPKEKIAVLEVDERSSLRVYKYIKPDFLICNNIMRDSIKRNANTDFIRYIIGSSLTDSTRVILNGDDCICSSIAPVCTRRTYFGMDCDIPAVSEEPFISDITYCPDCGEKLEWEYRRFNHIGRCKCPKCGGGTPERDFTVTDFNVDAGTFTVKHNGEDHTYGLISDNIVNVYNSCGAIALLTEFGLSVEQISRGFENTGIVKTRLDSETVNGTEVISLLAKGQNPCAVARCFSWVASAPGEKKAVVCIFDDYEDNIHNSENPTWIYCLDYRPLKSDTVKSLVFGGERFHDHRLRCEMTGIDMNKVSGCTDTVSAASCLENPSQYDRIFILFDNYRTTENAKVRVEIINRLRGE